MTKKFFRRFSWFLVGYNVLVILWGAVVRSTGSGAGCGSHWPLCNGQVVPQPNNLETIIEFSHRLSSALDGLLVIVLVGIALRLYGKKSLVFWWSVAALVFIIIEGMLGRLLVVQNWVADNVSMMRAIVVATHLVNTYILLFTLATTAWLANQKAKITKRKLRIANILLIIGLILSILFSAMGAITALGDTLFPSQSFFDEVQKNFDPTSNFLIRLRIIHPILAILTGSYLYIVTGFILRKNLSNIVNRRGNWLRAVIIVQVLVGGVTVLTLAPIHMQISHLFMADVFWISLVLFSLEVYTVPTNSTEGQGAS